MRHKQKILLITLLCWGLCAYSFAAVPHLINYQGRLTDKDNKPLEGAYSLTFRIYDAETAGNLLWQETQSSVVIQKGVFSVLLGSVTDLNLAFDIPYFLEIKVGEEVMSPRQRITSAGYALAADAVRGAENVFPSSGNVGVGTVSPAYKLDVKGDVAFNNTLYIAASTAQGGIDSYTKLMLHTDGPDGSTTFTDFSSGAKSVTANGNAQIDTAQSKLGGASGLFDGNGDYLSLADSDDWNFGAGDFTIDFWVRFNRVDEDIYFVSQYQNDTNYWYIARRNGSVLNMFFSNGTAKANYSVSWTPLVNTWYHLVFERTMTSAKIFVNGISQSLTEDTAFGTNGVGDLTTSLYIGCMNSVGYVNGWLDELRISKGIARWTSNFTSPSAPYDDGGSSVNVGIGTASPGQKLTVAGTVESTSGGIKFPDGTIQTSAAGGYTNMQVFTNSGTWIRPPGVSKVLVKLIGGGGGSGVAGGFNFYAGGAGGTSSFSTLSAIGGGGGGAGGGGSGIGGSLNLTGTSGSSGSIGAVGGHPWGIYQNSYGIGGSISNDNPNVALYGGGGGGYCEGVVSVSGDVSVTVGGGGAPGGGVGGAGTAGIVIVYW